MPPYFVTVTGVTVCDFFCIANVCAIFSDVFPLLSLAGAEAGAERDAGPGEPQRQPGKTDRPTFCKSNTGQMPDTHTTRKLKGYFGRSALLVHVPFAQPKGHKAGPRFDRRLSLRSKM